MRQAAPEGSSKKGEKKTMVTRYRRNSMLYSFYLHDNSAGTGYKTFITIVKTPDDENQPEIIKNVPVIDAPGYSIKINKKSISANGGARGAFAFIRDCIRNDFMMIYVNKIVEQFIA